MVSRVALEEHFSNIGATLANAVLAKCEELCTTYSIDEEELAETWTAYSISKNMDIDPTLGTLRQMERAELGKRKTNSTPRTSTPSSIAVYNSSVADDSFDEDILSTYGATPKAKKPDSTKKGYTPESCSSPHVVFSPASFSPSVATQSSRYAGRSNAGNVLCKFGCTEGVQWSCISSFDPTVTAQLSVSANACYMFDTLRERASLHKMNMKFIANVIKSKTGLNEMEDISELHTEEFQSWGRICYTSGNTLSLNNLCLESLVGEHPSIVPMDVKIVPKLSVFPGQVVAIKAKNPTRSKLVVHDIFSDASMPLPEEPLRFSKKGSLHIVVASGPYTLVDTMTYQPLEDFLQYLRKHRPHIAILIGPFIDEGHSHVRDGLLAETFESFFEKQIDNIMQSVEGMQIQIVLVSSSREVHHHAIFPTPQYTLKKKYSNLHLMGDPCILDVDGLKVAVTSVDVLKHIANEEIVNAANNNDRLGRIAKHILMQNNFYPLYPPSEHVNVDTKLWYDHCHLPFTPHLLFLPSDLRAFVKEINGCVLVNPERLAKGLVGGSFVRLEVKAMDKWDPQSVACEVIRI